MNTGIVVPNTIEVQQGEQRVSETNMDGESVSGMVFPIKGALSNILRNEEAFQSRLKEIDMELQGHMHNDEGLNEGGAKSEEVGLMVEKSKVADINSGVVEPFVQTGMDLTKAVSHLS